MSATPPGPKGLPLVKNTYHYARDPFTFISTYRRAYGDISRFTLGTEETYMITNPADIERVLVSEEAKYEKPQSFQSGGIGELLGKGLLLSSGDFWRRQRRRAQPAFAPRRVAQFGDTIIEYAEAMIREWSEGETIEIDPIMARITVKVIVRVMFGTEIDERTTRQVQDNLEPLGKMFEPDPVQFLLPEWVLTPDRIEFRKAVSNLDTVLDSLIRQRNETEDGGTDLLSILLRARRDIDEVTDDLLRDELMTILLAGHDTTALSLTYSWFLLAQYPEVEARLHAELDEVLGGEPPTASDIRNLDYTERVIKEAMRLYPPVYALFREPRVDVQLAGYRIPAGSLTMLPQWGVHRDPRWYDDPLTFDPDRWTRARASDRPNYAYYPFGGGSRHCIGKHLSMLEAQLILATVAQKYRLELAPTQKTSLDLNGSLTMHPASPIELNPSER